MSNLVLQVSTVVLTLQPGAVALTLSAVGPTLTLATDQDTFDLQTTPLPLTLDVTSQSLTLSSAGSVTLSLGVGAVTAIGVAGGDLSGAYPNPDVVAVHESGANTRLPIGPIVDGEFVLRTSGQLEGSPAGVWQKQTFTATAGQTTFTLSSTPADGNSTRLDVNNMSYVKDLDWSISGNVVTWLDNSFVMVAGDVVEVQWFDALNSPPLGSVDLGTPTDGSFTDGLVPLTPSTTVVDGVDLLNEALQTNEDEKGAANGTAQLDGTGKVPDIQIPQIADETVEPLVITVDPIGGSDAATGRYVTQAAYTARGAFATVPVAVNSLPTNLIHNVTISLVDGNHTIGLDGLGNLSRFKFMIRDMSDAGLGFTALTFASANGLVRVSGTSLMSVQSATTRQVTLTADPGFSVDQYQSFWMRVVSGTGAGQIAPIRSHATTVFETVPTWSPVLDGTSQVEIVSPGAILDLPTPSRFSTYGRSGLGLNNSTIRFSAVDLKPTASDSFVGFNDSSVYLTDGTRVLDTTLLVSTGFLLLGDCIIDAGNGSFSSFAGCIFLSSAFLRSRNSSQKRLLINSAGPGIAHQSAIGPGDRGVATLWLFRMAIDNCVDGIDLDGPGTLKLSVDVTSQNNTGHGVVLKRVALVTTDTSFVDELTGAVGDFQLDGVSKSWAQLDAVTPDKAMIGPHQSFIQKDV